MPVVIPLDVLCGRGNQYNSRIGYPRRYMPREASRACVSTPRPCQGRLNITLMLKVSPHLVERCRRTSVPGSTADDFAAARVSSVFGLVVPFEPAVFDNVALCPVGVLRLALSDVLRPGLSSLRAGTARSRQLWRCARRWRTVS